jgi:2,5-furandicarboxylate decarboxylase 1
MDDRTTQQLKNSIDIDKFRLRTFIESLKGSDQLDIREDKVDLADMAAVMQGNPKAVWFKKAGPEGVEVVGNVVGGRERLARAFGVDQKAIVEELLRRLALPPQIVTLSREEAPVQQVVITGDDIDVLKMPAHLQHAFDGAPYISATVDFCVDPATGLSNCGLRRLMLRGPKETGVDLNAPSDLRAIYMAASARGEKLPVAYVIGMHPIDHVAATMKQPGDELGLISSLRAAPLPVVKCVTNDVMVPADAEIVLEGYLDPAGYTEKEGPYGEYLGYYGGVKMNPVFRVTAITHRKDALFQTTTISGSRMDLTDTSNLEALRTELNAWEALKSVVREPVAVYAPVSAGGSMSVRFSLKQRYPGEARSALHTVLGSTAAKHAFAVDPDIDIFNDAAFEWAFGTRFQGDKDLILATGVRLSPLDPSLHGAHTGTKCGFDCTWPMQHASKWELQIPVPPQYPGKKFPSLRAALEDGPKRFEDLMAATGSRDGREIVRELFGLRDKGLERDELGRYFLKG